MSFYEITKFSCEVPVKEVLNRMGMPGGRAGEEEGMLLEVKKELVKYKQDLWKNMESLALISSGEIESAGQKIPVAACVTTLGSRMEQWISQLFECGEIFAAMVMDAASDVYLFQMQKELSCGLSLLCREQHAGIEGRILIPEDLPMEVQKQIADMTHAKQYGITLNNAYVFSPLKTVSLLFRLGEEGKFCIAHDCSRCQRRDGMGKVCMGQRSE